MGSHVGDVEWGQPMKGWNLGRESPSGLVKEEGKERPGGKDSIRTTEFLGRSNKANEEDTLSLPCFSLCLFP